MKNNIGVATISVIMPVKDVSEDLLSESIRSIINQSFRNIELIIVDDHSVESVSKKLTFQDHRIQVIRLNEDHGISAALNKGISIAKGKYIARMDADDVAMQDRLKIQKDFLDKYNNIHVVGSWTKVFGDQNYIRKTKSNPDAVAIEMIFRCAIAHPSVMFRPRIFKSMQKIYDSKFDGAEDYELWSRLIRKKNIANIPLPLLSYRVHKKQSGSVKAKKQEELSDQIRSKMLVDIIEDISQEEITIHNKISKYQVSNKDNPNSMADWLVKIHYAMYKSLKINIKDVLVNLCYESIVIIYRFSYNNKIAFIYSLIFGWLKASIR